MSIVEFIGWIMGRREAAGPLELRIRAWMLRNLPGLVTCAELERFVIDYHEGTLTPTERSVFQIHLEMCPPCSAHFASYLETIELGRLICRTEDSAARPALPEGLKRAILAARLAR